jgi:hypothetical protein
MTLPPRHRSRPHRVLDGLQFTEREVDHPQLPLARVVQFCGDLFLGHLFRCLQFIRILDGTDKRAGSIEATRLVSD